MNDRFRFRVWNNRDWDSEFGQVYYNAEETYDFLRGNPQIPASSFDELLEDDQWIVEQCTGLKDKNGKLIYEGDIIKAKDWGDKRIVCWSQESCSYRLKNEYYDCGGLYLDVIEELEYEIIGNIHEQESK